MKYQNSYLLTLQFLGFRFHGWQKQPKTKTLHQAVDKTLGFALNHTEFKTLGAGRTDAKVSSTDYKLALYCNEEIILTEFREIFNRNAPSDLRLVLIQAREEQGFDVIRSSKLKEYHYYFSNSGKNHPYAAPFLAGFQGLDVDIMKQGAKLFEGTHFFGSYCTKPSSNTVLVRTIKEAYIIQNKVITANFFPEQSFVFVVKGAGFLRYQIRLMMGALLELGLGNLKLSDIQDSLQIQDEIAIATKIAPGSGLHLYRTEFE